MKKLFFLVFSGVFVFTARSAIVTWDGEAFTASWNDPLNWSGDLLPAAGDDVLLDNAVVAGSFDVLLPAGDVSVSINRLRIRPDPGYRIRLLLPPANISLTAFRATGDADAVTLDEGAELINESGATVSSTPVAVTGAGFFRINNGGRYVHRTARSATDNLVSRLSSEPGTEYGIFEFDVTVASYIVSLSGRTFGTLVLNAATNQSMVNYRGSCGNPLTVRGDLRLMPDVTFTLSLSSEMKVAGNLVTEATSLFNLQSTDNNNRVSVQGNLMAAGTITETGTGLPVLELNGALHQEISIASLLNQVELRLDNPVSCELLSQLNISYRLALVSGRLLSSIASPVVIAANATCSRVGGLVEGPVTKLGFAGFVFPVGRAAIYAPLEIPGSIQSAPADGMTVEYIRANPQSSVGIGLDQTGHGMIDHISQVEYWKLDMTGTVPAALVLDVNAESFSRNLAGTMIVQFVDGRWRGIGNGILAGPVTQGGYETGRLLSGTFDLGGYVTLASSLPVAENPLPVELISFDVSGEGNGIAAFSFRLSEPPSGLEQFIISQAAGDSLPADCLFINAIAGKMIYDHRAAVLKPGTNQFRLRMQDAGQPIFYSRILTIEGDPVIGSIQLAAIFPNPVQQMAWLRINVAQSTSIELLVRNASGLPVKRIKTQVGAGNTLIPLSLEDLRSGCYFLTGMTTGGQTNTICFLRG